MVRVVEVEEERMRLLRTAMDCHCKMVVWGYPGGAEHELDKYTAAAAAAVVVRCLSLQPGTMVVRLCWDIR